MKRGTPDHWKMKDLSRRLNIPPMYAISWANGCMERIWHYAARYCLQGDIGRVPDEEIAEVVGWPVKAARRLVDALTQARWLDACPTHRLLIHDWPEHCDESVKKTLKNRGLQFFFRENSGMILENSSLARAEALALALAKPSRAEPEETALPGILETNEPFIIPKKPFPCAIERPKPAWDFPVPLKELEEAWERHKAFSPKEPFQVVIQSILSMGVDFDVERFRERHEGYCEHWAEKGWTAFGVLTFWAWIQAKMPEAPAWQPRRGRRSA